MLSCSRNAQVPFVEKLQLGNSQFSKLQILIQDALHETWQLVNSFECLLLWTVLDIKHFLHFVYIYSYMFYFVINLTIIHNCRTTFLLFSLVSINLKNDGRRHLKLFTNCHVSWEILYLIHTWSDKTVKGTVVNCRFKKLRFNYL